MAARGPHNLESTMAMPVQALAANPGAVWTHTFHWAAYFPELLSTFAGRTFTTHWGCPGAAEHLEANGAFGA